MKCHTAECRSPAAIPEMTYWGLCMKCYSEAKKMVEAGDTSWQQLEELGLVRGKSSPFLSGYRKASEINKPE